MSGAECPAFCAELGRARLAHGEVEDELVFLAGIFGDALDAGHGARRLRAGRHAASAACVTTSPPGAAEALSEDYESALGLIFAERDLAADASEQADRRAYRLRRDGALPRDTRKAADYAVYGAALAARARRRAEVARRVYSGRSVERECR